MSQIEHWNRRKDLEEKLDCEYIGSACLEQEYVRQSIKNPDIYVKVLKMPHKSKTTLLGKRKRSYVHVVVIEDSRGPGVTRYKKIGRASSFNKARKQAVKFVKKTVDPTEIMTVDA